MDTTRGLERVLAFEWFFVMSGTYRVFIVLDKEYGERLSELNQAGPVWIVDTPRNRAAAQKIWEVAPNRSHLEGVTAFKINADDSPEDNLVNELDAIDLHHGIHSANPPYTVLEAVGVQINKRLETELSKFGFNQFQSTEAGFIAVRPVPHPNF